MPYPSSVGARGTGSILFLLGQGPAGLAALQEDKMRSEGPPGWPASRSVVPKVFQEISKEGV